MKNYSYSLSIVSHGQGALVKNLLRDLVSISALQPERDEIVITLNIPEDESFLDIPANIPVRVIRNKEPKGFGTNHNNALSTSSRDAFIIINPDIRIQGLNLHAVEQSLSRDEVGVVGPKVLNSLGAIEDSARKFPTILSLLLRQLRVKRHLDYKLGDDPIQVDWVAGMFLFIRRSLFLQIGGFDPKYFLYMEDVDLSKRLAKMGYLCILDPRVTVMHDAQRSSHRDIKYLFWHLKSALRYFLL